MNSSIYSIRIIFIYKAWRYETPGLSKWEFADSLLGLTMNEYVLWMKSSAVHASPTAVIDLITQYIIDDRRE
jgi:hypothetical protein